MGNNAVREKRGYLVGTSSDKALSEEGQSPKEAWAPILSQPLTSHAALILSQLCSSVPDVENLSNLAFSL